MSEPLFPTDWIERARVGDDWRETLERREGVLVCAVEGTYRCIGGEWVLVAVTPNPVNVGYGPIEATSPFTVIEETAEWNPETAERMRDALARLKQFPGRSVVAGPTPMVERSQ